MINWLDALPKPALSNSFTFAKACVFDHSFYLTCAPTWFLWAISSLLSSWDSTNTPHPQLPCAGCCSTSSPTLNPAALPPHPTDLALSSLEMNHWPSAKSLLLNSPSVLTLLCSFQALYNPNPSYFLLSHDSFSPFLPRLLLSLLSSSWITENPQD